MFHVKHPHSLHRAAFDGNYAKFHVKSKQKDLQTLVFLYFLPLLSREYTFQANDFMIYYIVVMIESVGSPMFRKDGTDMQENKQEQVRREIRMLAGCEMEEALALVWEGFSDFQAQDGWQQ